jgi:putative restriction endonuclease
MTKAVLTTKVSPAYDDLPEERYHFPRAYLNQIRQALNDCIIYYEPRRQDSGCRKTPRFALTGSSSTIIAPESSSDNTRMAR